MFPLLGPWESATSFGTLSQLQCHNKDLLQKCLHLLELELGLEIISTTTSAKESKQSISEVEIFLGVFTVSDEVEATSFK